MRERSKIQVLTDHGWKNTFDVLSTDRILGNYIDSKIHYHSWGSVKDTHMHAEPTILKRVESTPYMQPAAINGKFLGLEIASVAGWYLTKLGLYGFVNSKICTDGARRLDLWEYDDKSDPTRLAYKIGKNGAASLFKGMMDVHPDRFQTHDRWVADLFVVLATIHGDDTHMVKKDGLWFVDFMPFDVPYDGAAHNFTVVIDGQPCVTTSLGTITVRNNDMVFRVNCCEGE